MYVSIDEACTHVDAPAFRLLAAVYDAAGHRLLGSGVSPPIRVLANNDVPTGAARIPLEAQLPSDWEGWAAEEEVSGAAAAPAAAQRPKRIRTRSRRVAVRGLACRERAGRAAARGKTVSCVSPGTSVLPGASL